MISSAKYWIEKLNLEKHPEGGWFKEVYRSEEVIPKEALPDYFSGSRNISTSIYYLLEGDNFSAFHRIKSDEIWHYYAGTSALEIVSIKDGRLKKQLIGTNPEENQVLQYVVPKNTWFASRLFSKSGYALVGCTVSPGFHFEDFTMAGKELLEEYPHLLSEIKDLIRF